jgi:hypothetical protein
MRQKISVVANEVTEANEANEVIISMLYIKGLICSQQKKMSAKKKNFRLIRHNIFPRKIN